MGSVLKLFSFHPVFSSTEPSGSSQEWLCKDEDVSGSFVFDEKQKRNECEDECRQTDYTPERYERKLVCLA